MLMTGVVLSNTRMRNAAKTQQLRVRVSEEQRAALNELVIQRAKDETLSDLVREILDEFISPKGDRIRCQISRTVYDRVAKLARVLDRDEQQVVEQCLANVCDVIDRPEIKTPLIVVEHQLRQEYQGKKSDKS